MDEREALDRMRRGDIRGLEAVVRQHQLRAVRTAFLVVREPTLAQDVVQAAFVRAFERIGQLDPDRPFGPWFLTSVLHDAIKAAARRERHAPLDSAPTPVDPQPGPDALWERAETADEIWAALETLTPEQRAAVVARYYLGLSETEMTALLDCRRSTVKWRLHAARARLRLILTPLIAND